MYDDEWCSLTSAFPNVLCRLAELPGVVSTGACSPALPQWAGHVYAICFLVWAGVRGMS